MGSLEGILAGYEGLRASQEAFYKDLHRHPELSHQEHRTAERVAGKLQEYGCTVQTGIGGTGVVGVLANGGGPTVRLPTRQRWLRSMSNVRGSTGGGKPGLRGERSGVKDRRDLPPGLVAEAKTKPGGWGLRDRGRLRPR